jgi:DNA-directed RNA polymerase subunit F
VSDFSQLLGVGRAVLVKQGEWAGSVGVITEQTFDLFFVNHNNGFTGHKVNELEPLFMMDQVVSVKLAEQQPGSDLSDKVKSFGMSSDDLAEYVQEFITDCVNRIKGAGNAQYSEDGYQKFEILDLDDLFEYLEEELRDIPNYLAMLFIRMRRIREALKAVDIIPEKEEEIPSE